MNKMTGVMIKMADIIGDMNFQLCKMNTRLCDEID